MIIGSPIIVGASKPKASIKVTAKAGALLNLHYKDSSIILQSYQLGTEEIQHTFAVNMSETAYVVEDVTNVKSVEVLVDAITLYSVEIMYNLWLYDGSNNGNEFISITGGWKSFVSRTDPCDVNWHTAKKIDLSPYKKMCFELEGKEGISGRGLSIIAGFSDADNKNASGDYPIYGNGGNVSRRIVSLDITNINKELFVVIGSHHNPYYSSGNAASKGSNYLYIDCYYIYSPGEREYIWLYKAWLES